MYSFVILAAFSVCYYSGIMLLMGDDPTLNGFMLMELLLQRPASHAEAMHYVLTVSVSFGCFALLAPAAMNCIRSLQSTDETSSL